MPVSFDQLRLVRSSALARRAFWHLLSVGTVWRDEVERHEGADKAGLHLFWVRRGTGWLETPTGRWPLSAGTRCWLVDLRLQRAYEPAPGSRLVTESFRFSGPMLEAWLDLLGGPGEISMGHKGFDRLRAIRRTLYRLARLPAAKSTWPVHELLTQAWGELLESRERLLEVGGGMTPAVQRVLDAVLARPDHDWQASELAETAGISYSGLRAAFKAARGETLHEFLQQVRLDQARLWLSDPRLSIKQVSARLGFRSETYFAHWFRALSGHTPREHRQMLRG